MLNPFIFLTAKDTIKDCSKGMDIGANGYLTKPIGWKELLTAVEIGIKKIKVYKVYGL